MNLQEIVAALPAKGLRAKLQQQELRIKQLEEENQWLRKQILVISGERDKKKNKKLR